MNRVVPVTMIIHPFARSLGYYFSTKSLIIKDTIQDAIVDSASKKDAECPSPAVTRKPHEQHLTKHTVQDSQNPVSN